MKKRLILNINDEMKQVFLKVGTGNWLNENIPKYNPEIVSDNPKYSKKSLFRPKVSLETFRALQDIPGESNTQRVVNLYYNIKKQNKKTKNRERILKELFPNHPYLKK